MNRQNEGFQGGNGPREIVPRSSLKFKDDRGTITPWPTSSLKTEHLDVPSDRPPIDTISNI